MLSDQATIRWLAILTGARALDVGQIALYLGRFDSAGHERIFGAAVAERLAPVVYCTLRDRGLFATIPPEWQEALFADYRLNQALYMEQAAALSRLADVLSAERVSFRLLKGLAVAARAYDTPTARSVGDLDIWVLPRDLARAEQALLAAGLERVPSTYPAPYLRDFLGEQAFSPPDALEGQYAPAGWRLTTIDMHSHLVKPWWLRETLNVDEQEIYARCQPVTIAGRSYQTLDPTDTLHYLCLHVRGGYHLQPWRCLLDIQQLLGHAAIDWRRLNAESGAWGTRTYLWRAFTLIDQACGTRRAARLEGWPTSLHRRAIKWVLPLPLPGVREPQSDPGASRLPVASLLLLPGPAAMVGATRRLLWPSAQWFHSRYALPVKSGGSLLRARLRYLRGSRYFFRRMLSGKRHT